MSTLARSVLRDFVPPALLRSIDNRLRRYGWFGDYADWAAAQRDATGYDSKEILEKVTTALLAVKKGEAAFERDSVSFEKPEYRWPLLASLLSIAAARNGNLRVLDFGGSLGSTYFQHRKFLATLASVRWSIVEQPAFVERGRALFQDQSLRFYESIDSCLQCEQPDVLLLGSVLQYLPDPYGMLAESVARGFDYLIVDRTPFITNGRELLTVQRVDPRVYAASYPGWFLDRERFLSAMSSTYRVKAEFPCDDRANIPGANFVGFFFESIRLPE